MSNKLITFFGATFALFVFGGILTALEFSGSTSSFELLGRLFASFAAGTVFLGLELFFSSHTNRGFPRILFEAARVSILGSYILFISLYLALLLFGYTTFNSIARDLISIVVLSGILSTLVFITTLILRIFHYIVVEKNSGKKIEG